MNPHEERARALANQIFASGHGWPRMASNEAEALIASALRDAENEALERFATAVEKYADGPDVMGPLVTLLQGLARSLKHKD